MNRKWIKITVALLVGAFLAGLAVVMLRPKENLFPPLPNPNGYDDFINAAQSLPANWRDYPYLSNVQQRAFVESARHGLTQSLPGFDRECVVPVQFTEVWMVQTHLENLNSIKNLAVCLSAAGAVAEQDGDFTSALEWNLRANELGHKSSRGGTLIDMLAGMNCQEISHEGLSGIVTNLNMVQSKQLAQKLERWESELEDLDVIFKRDQDWARRASGIYYFRYVFEGSWDEANLAKGKQLRGKISRTNRQIMLRAAARAYELERGKAPLRAADLVPDYLQAVPKDPETGLDMELKR